VVGFHKFQVVGWWTVAQKSHHYNIYFRCIFLFCKEIGSSGELFCLGVVIDKFVGNHKAPTTPRLSKQFRPTQLWGAVCH
jgi:hypothetical protein